MLRPTPPHARVPSGGAIRAQRRRAYSGSRPAVDPLSCAPSKKCMLENGARALRRRRPSPAPRRAACHACPRPRDRATEGRRGCPGTRTPAATAIFRSHPAPSPLAARARLTHSPRPPLLRAVAALGERPPPHPSLPLPTRAASRSALSRTALTWRKSSATCAGREGGRDVPGRRARGE